MKKFLIFFVCILLLVSFSACTKDNIETNAGSSKISITESVHHEAETSSLIATSSEPEVENSLKINLSSQKEFASSKNDGVSSKIPTSTSSKTESASSKNTANTSSKNTSSKTQDSSSVEEAPILGDPNLVPGVDYGYYYYYGQFVSTAIYEDISYSVYKTPNILVVYDTENLKLLGNITLPGRACEVKVNENYIMISYPDLKCLILYNKTTFEEFHRANLENSIGSFWLDTATLYYADENQHSYIYRTNIFARGETKLIDRTFSSPTIILNAEKDLLYIGEMHTTNSTLHYYSFLENKIVSAYINNGSFVNQLRTLFHIGDYVYWGGMKFDTQDATNPIAQFSSSYRPRLYFANEKYVAVDQTVYDANTYQHILTLTDADYITLTKSENLIVDVHDPVLPHTVLIIPG